MTNEELVSLIQAGQLDKLLELWNQVEHNVYKAASKQAWDTRGFGGVTAKDLYQSGYIALVAAVNSYVPDEGCSFKTWLEFYIKEILC